MNVTPPDRNAPLRLSRAAEIAFPGGGMTASGLRKEAAKGRLSIHRVANKDFVTLAAIDAMLADCRVEPKRSQAVPRRPVSASQTALDSLLMNVKRQTRALSGREPAPRA